MSYQVVSVVHIYTSECECQPLTRQTGSGLGVVRLLKHWPLLCCTLHTVWVWCFLLWAIIGWLNTISSWSKCLLLSVGPVGQWLPTLSTASWLSFERGHVHEMLGFEALEALMAAVKDSKQTDCSWMWLPCTVVIPLIRLISSLMRRDSELCQCPTPPIPLFWCNSF